MTRKIKAVDAVIMVYVICAVATDDGALLMKIARVLLVVTMFVELLRRKKKIRHPYIRWSLSFALFAMISIIWATNKDFAIQMAISVWTNSICMISLIYLVSIKKQRLRLIINMMIFAPLVLETRMILIGGPLIFITSRYFASMSANTVGLASCVACCFAYREIICIEEKKTNNSHKAYYWWMIAINVVITLLSASRKPVMFIGIYCLFIYLFGNRKNVFIRLRKVTIGAVSVFGAYLALIHIPVLYNAVGHRIQSLLALGTGNLLLADDSALTRSNLINKGIQWFLDNPVIGYGIDNYRWILHLHSPGYPLTYYAHNNFIELLVDTGLIGTIIYYSAFVSALYSSYKNQKRFMRSDFCLFGMLIAFVISDIGMVSYYNRITQIALLILFLHLLIEEKQRVVRKL